MAVNKPVPVPKGFKLGPGASAVIPGKSVVEVTLGGSDPSVAPVATVPASILDIPNPETGHVGHVPQHVAKAKAKKAKAPKVAAVVLASSPEPKPTVIDELITAASGAVGVPLLGTSGTTFKIMLTPDLLAKIQKPVTGMGGWQRVMLELKAATVYDTPGPPDPVSGLPFAILTLTPNLLDRLITLAVKHGSGGYQSVIRHIVCLTLAQHKGAILGGK